MRARARIDWWVNEWWGCTFVPMCLFEYGHGRHNLGRDTAVANWRDLIYHYHCVSWVWSQHMRVRTYGCRSLAGGVLHVLYKWQMTDCIMYSNTGTPVSSSLSCVKVLCITESGWNTNNEHAPPYITGGACSQDFKHMEVAKLHISNLTCT